MVERPEHEHDVIAGVGGGQLASVAELGDYAQAAKVSVGLGHMARREIYDPNSVTIGGEPRGMHARAPADV